MGRKFALLIGNNVYQDNKLSKLKTPASDVKALASVLRDPAIGEFDKVTKLINQNHALVSQNISKFFAQRMPEDLLLLYFSGHGILDSQGRLYLAVKDTDLSILRPTSIEARFINEEIDDCRSKRQILILDCCHSGAYVQGAKGPEKEVINGATFKGNGYGRVVLTASNSTQYALEGDQVVDQAELSLFSHYLLEGLTTGGADPDGDGFISLDDWYNYTYEKIVNRTPKQTPLKWTYNQKGDFIVAKNPKGSVIKNIANVTLSDSPTNTDQLFFDWSTNRDIEQLKLAEKNARELSRYALYAIGISLLLTPFLLWLQWLSTTTQLGISITSLLILIVQYFTQKRIERKTKEMLQEYTKKLEASRR
jgi:uncharacterized caspase-like protein